MVSCSSDSSIVVSDLKFEGDDVIANSIKSKTISRINAHFDFVKKINTHESASNQSLTIFSIGLDGYLYQHDLLNDASVHKICSYNSKHSLYSLASKTNGNEYLVATGGTDNIIRLYDTHETREKHIFKLKGHSDNVRSLLLTDSNLCISASSDNSIRIWDLRIEKCIKKILIHEDSVWNLVGENGTNSFYSGGRDGKVFFTNPDTDKTQFLYKNENPILSIAPASVNKNFALWLSSTDPCLNCYNYSNDSAHIPLTLASPTINSVLMDLPVTSNVLTINDKVEDPKSKESIIMTCSTKPITSFQILSDKFRVLTNDSSGRVLLWDIVNMKILDDLGVMSIENALKQTQSQIYLPNWFSADIKCGVC